MLLVPNSANLAAGGETVALPIVRDAVKTVAAQDRVNRLLLLADFRGIGFPHLDGLVIAYCVDQLAVRGVGNTPDESVMGHKVAGAGAVGQIPNTHLAVISTSGELGQLLWVLPETRDTISVAAQVANEGFGKHTVQFSGIQSPDIFPRTLQGMQSRIVVPGH